MIVKHSLEKLNNLRENFIYKAAILHGKKYDYSQVIYQNSSEKVKIICLIHGAFEQRPNDHLQGKGCVACGHLERAEKRKMSANELIKKAKAVHGNKDDYSGMKRLEKSKISINCRLHGEFEQNISKHLSGHGCPLCSKNRKLNTNTFIAESLRIHGQAYDYTETIFQKWDTKLKIICREHGAFNQTPNSHLQGAGCPKCGRIETAKKLKLSNSDFLRKCIEVHGDKYGYEHVNYKNYHSIVKINCTKHGVFSQIAHLHLSGSGCPECANITRADANRLTTKEFIQKAKEIHGFTYDYELTDYHGSHKPILIRCTQHGEFLQIASTHLDGSGCPSCGKLLIGYTLSLSREEFIKRAQLRHGQSYSYKDVNYVNNRTKIKIYCAQHGFFTQMPVKHISGDGCPECGLQLLSIYRTKTTDEFVAEAILVHGYKYNYGEAEYKHAKEPIQILCHHHGYFYQTPDNHLQGYDCPECSRNETDSKGVKLISKILQDFDIEFEREARFPTCKDILQLPFDFYLAAHNILIEFDGEQHFKPIHHWGGMKAFEGLQKRDNIKNLWAKKNSIKLFRVRFDDNVKNVMQDILREIC